MRSNVDQCFHVLYKKRRRVLNCLPYYVQGDLVTLNRITRTNHEKDNFLSQSPFEVDVRKILSMPPENKPHDAVTLSHDLVSTFSLNTTRQSFPKLRALVETSTCCNSSLEMNYISY